MEMISKSMTTLFEQLGESSDEVSIALFIQLHGTLKGGVLLHEAPCWTAAQAGFLKEALTLDAAWAPVVDELNARLHQARLSSFQDPNDLMP